MKNLKQYVAQKNLWAGFMKRPLLDAERLTRVQVRELLDSIECDLSPENLCCDGELRGAALQKKARMLNGAKRELELMVA